MVVDVEYQFWNFGQRGMISGVKRDQSRLGKVLYCSKDGQTGPSQSSGRECLVKTGIVDHRLEPHIS